MISQLKSSHDIVREKKFRPLKNFSGKKDFFPENVIFKGHSLHVDWEDFLVTVGECVKG